MRGRSKKGHKADIVKEPAFLSKGRIGIGEWEDGGD